MPADRLRIVCLAASLLALPGLAPAAQPTLTADLEAFEKEVRPVLIEQCGRCHGPDKQKGGLRLDSRQALLEGGQSGPSIVAGHPDESLLIEAVRQEGDIKMPPRPGRKLTEPQVAALERWITAGAPWPADQPAAVDPRKLAWARHWAFQPIADPQPPQVRDSTWSRTPVDAFIKARLEAAGLPSSPPIDRAKLIRRVTYDLTGLPPTPEEVKSFVNDPAPDAYAKLVERLLASDHYGEQWARHWLDVARYADTKGYVYGREERFFVHAPAYRDWVVRAFNSDLPYDRFLLDQIAADQAEPDNPSALAAMGFLTVGRRFLGVTHDIIDDRIDVLTRGTMGMTVACARCHDHKYDPIPTADYYALYGVFQNCTERLVPLGEPTTEDDAYRAFEKELNVRRETLRKGMAASRTEASKRVRERIATYLLAQRDLSKIPQEGFDVVLGKDDLNPAFVRRWQAYLAAAAKADDTIFRPWRRFSALSDAEFASQAPAESKALVESEGSPLNPIVARAFATPPASIQEVAERYGTLFKDVDRRWQELLSRGGQDSKATPTSLPEPEAEALRQVLYAERSPCQVPVEPIVTTEWFFDSGTVVQMWKLQGDVDRWLIQSPQAPPYALALVDREELREPRIFRRGSPANQGDVVPRRFLLAIAGPDRKPFAHGSGRLELARAIIDPSNPLTARVWVNRIWTHHFGAGLVRTPSDFGLRAEPPSHPELLDWLARRLITEGWSTKAIHRLILLSNAYQQQSGSLADPRAREQALRVDPENRLLWRMNAHRLTFEEARDTLLAVTGELDHRLGGRSTDLFPTGTTNVRRSLYGLVDRQFLPSVLRVFDFANPDLHTPARSETTVPQQALFAMNHPFLAGRAQRLASKLPVADPDAAIGALFQAVSQRDPTGPEREAARKFLVSSTVEDSPPSPPETLAWHYGYGPVDAVKGPTREFHPLPHFNGSAWSGGPRWPDAKLGWVQLTAQGGHPGDDLKHAAIRRWTAERPGQVRITSTLVHQEAAGDGVRGWIVSSRHGVLRTAPVHNTRVDFHVESVTVEPGDTIDFVVDIRDGLNSDQHHWVARIQERHDAAGATDSTPSAAGTWDSSRDFAGPPPRRLTPWEQLAQVLLMSNELMFVD